MDSVLGTSWSMTDCVTTTSPAAIAAVDLEAPGQSSHGSASGDPYCGPQRETTCLSASGDSGVALDELYSRYYGLDSDQYSTPQDVTQRSDNSPERKNTQEHADLLATKWLSAEQLDHLAQDVGLLFKKGRFSSEEIQAVHTAIESYQSRNALGSPQIERLIFQTRKQEIPRDDTFWSEIALAVPNRSKLAVYHYVRRAFQPFRKQGSWTSSEDHDLIQAVEKIGEHWKAISRLVGRTASDCRDRYRNHLKHRNVRVNGRWTRAEEDELMQIMMDMSTKQDNELGDLFNISWQEVSRKMGFRRGRLQCSSKWMEMRRAAKNGGRKLRWSKQDTHVLVERIYAMGASAETDINWDILVELHGKLWSAHSLRKKWTTLKQMVDGFEHMAHREIVDILRSRHTPQMPSAIWMNNSDPA